MEEKWAILRQRQTLQCACWCMPGHDWVRLCITEKVGTRITRENEEKYIFRPHWLRGWEMHDSRGDAALEDYSEVSLWAYQQFSSESWEAMQACCGFPVAPCSVLSAPQVLVEASVAMATVWAECWTGCERRMLLINFIFKCFGNGLHYTVKS